MGERHKWLQLAQEARQAYLNARQRPLESLSLPCIGTIRITVLSGGNIPADVDSFCALDLNNQHVELRAGGGRSPGWNHAEVLCLASYDDDLRVSLYQYHKFTPNELLGYVDLSLNFLEYYNERATQSMELDLGNAMTVSLTLQYHSLVSME